MRISEPSYRIYQPEIPRLGPSAQGAVTWSDAGKAEVSEPTAVFFEALEHIRDCAPPTFTDLITLGLPTLDKEHSRLALWARITYAAWVAYRVVRKLNHGEVDELLPDLAEGLLTVSPIISSLAERYIPGKAPSLSPARAATNPLRGFSPVKAMPLFASGRSADLTRVNGAPPGWSDEFQRLFRDLNLEPPKDESMARIGRAALASSGVPSRLPSPYRPTNLDSALLLRHGQAEIGRHPGETLGLLGRRSVLEPFTLR